MNILLCVIEYQRSAVGKFSTQGNPVFLRQFQENLFPQLAQISGYDQAEIFRSGMQIVEMGPYGGVGGRGHGGSHVVGIFDTKVFDSADGTGCDFGSVTMTAYQRGSGTGDSPLRGWGSLTTVAQREAILAL